MTKYIMLAWQVDSMFAKKDWSKRIPITCESMRTT